MPPDAGLDDDLDEGLNADVRFRASDRVITVCISSCLKIVYTHLDVRQLANKSKSQQPTQIRLFNAPKILYHGATEQYADAVQRYGFKISRSSPDMSLADKFEMAKSYADCGNSDVIVVRVSQVQRQLQ